MNNLHNFTRGAALNDYMHAIEYLQASVWKHPESYGGFSPKGDYVVMTRNRNSSLLDNVNWEVAVERLKAEAMDHGTYDCVPADRPNVYHWRAGHWAVGWVEYLMVRADAPAHIQSEAGEILCALAEHPILNDARYSDAEFNAVCDYWARCSVAERVEYLQDAGLPIWAARRDSLPESDSSGALYQRLSGGF